MDFVARSSEKSTGEARGGVIVNLWQRRVTKPGDFAADRSRCSILLIALKAYRYSLSPMFMALGVRCRFEPSCSHYAEVAIQRHGIRGIFLALWRLVRCQPFCRGGYDPVPMKEECCG